MRHGHTLMASLMIGLVTGASCGAKPFSDPHRSRSIRAVAVGRFDFESRDLGADAALAPEELSGITWIEGNRYLVVGDAHAAVHGMTIDVDPRSGAVRSASFGAPIPLRDAGGSLIPEPAMAEDREGIAYDPERREFWIANEQTGADRRCERGCALR